MRIGLVLDRFDPRLGGVEQWTFQFARWLIADGHEVHAAARTFGKEVRALPIRCHVLPKPASRDDFAISARAALEPLDLDIVHDMGAGWYANVVQPHGGSRHASFEQNLLLIPRWLRPLKRVMARFAWRYREFSRLSDRQFAADGRKIVAISQMVARDLARHHNVPSEQIRLVYNGVDLNRFSPELRTEHRDGVRDAIGARADDVLLLIVAHNFRLKGVPTLIRATARLVAEGLPARLVVAGGKRLAGAQRLAHKLGIRERSHFLGSVADPTPLYGAADVYVQPTFYDPCSLVVLEALACGLPIVTTQYNGAGELVTPGVEGAIIRDPADDRELADALRPLFDPARRASMGHAARRLAENHSFDRNCREMLAVYDEIKPHRAAA